MAKSYNQFSCPVVDLLTSEELHRALLRAVLVKQKIQDPDSFAQDNALESQVMYREVRLSDGTMAMMAAVSITKLTPVKMVAEDPQPKGQ